MLLNNKYVKFIGFTVKIACVAGAFWFIYRQIFYHKQGDDIKELFLQTFRITNDYGLLFLIFLLMFFNWSVEAIKWKYLIKKIEKISFFTGIEAVFSGITLSVFTPNRVGEFAGRIFFVEKADRWKAFIISVLGSFSQLMVTVVMGLLGYLFFIPRFTNLNKEIVPYLYYSIFVILILLILIIFFFYFNVSLVSAITRKYKKLKKLKPYFRVFSYYKNIELLIVFGLSLLRYIIFSIQFYLLLKVYGVDVSLFQGLIMISLSYFVLAVIPTIALSEIGVRGSVSLYFLGLLSTNNLGIVAASFTLWLINLAFPAIIGSIFVLKLNFFKKK